MKGFGGLSLFVVEVRICIHMICLFMSSHFDIWTTYEVWLLWILKLLYVYMNKDQEVELLKHRLLCWVQK